VTATATALHPIWRKAHSWQAHRLSCRRTTRWQQGESGKRRPHCYLTRYLPICRIAYSTRQHRWASLCSH